MVVCSARQQAAKKAFAFRDWEERVEEVRKQKKVIMECYSDPCNVMERQFMMAI